jgi:hypothetical protein
VVVRSEYMSRVLLIFLSFMLVMSSTASTAEGYQPGEFLALDLSKAALSPKPLGPANTFGMVPATVPAKARADRGVEAPYAHVPPPHPVRTVHVRAETPRGMARTRLAPRTRLAHRHRNPLDAQAMDARIQVWPCKSGGICKWKQ